MRLPFTSSSRRAGLLWLAIALIVGQSSALGGPINTDTALTPRKGGTILRLQYRYSEAEGLGPVRHASTSTAGATLVHGLTAKLALFLSVPYVHSRADRFAPQLGRFERTRDGIADLRVMAKYRFWQDDRRAGDTARWAALLGMNIRSGDSDFTSDSYDPIVGTVFSWRRDRDRLDADLVYQFNTGRNDHRHDTLRYDVAYSYRIFPQVLGGERLRTGCRGRAKRALHHRWVAGGISVAGIAVDRHAMGGRDVDSVARLAGARRGWA